MWTVVRNPFGVRFILTSILITVMLGLKPALPALAATLIVTNTNDSGAGSLRQAIASAVFGDTITFAPSLAGQTITLESDLIINKDLLINGSGLAPQLTVSGGDVAHLVIGNSTIPPTVTISDLTIVHGYSAGDGGAISVGGTLTLINCTLRNNHAAGDGGAISATNLTLKNTTLAQNQAVSGGALLIRGNGKSTIMNSTISQNQAGSGGAIAILGSTIIKMIHSTVADNTAASASELFAISTGSLQLSNTIMVCTPSAGGCIIQLGYFSIGSTNSLIGNGTIEDFGLANLADNGGPTQTMALVPESPLIDAGDDSVCANSPVNNLDQRGVTRPQGSHCDMGAFEAEDAVRPAVVSFDPENETLNVPVGTTVTITFSEEINPSTVDESSVFLTPFNSNTHIPAVVSSVGNVITLTPIDPLEVGRTFLFQVTGNVEDLAGNALNQVLLSTFTTGPNGVRDTTAAEFAAGMLGACYLSNIENGEVTLAPLIGEEFSGAALPANWSQIPLNNGAITISNDAISAEGAMAYYSNTTFTADHRLKFVGTFRSGQSQQVGLIGNTDFGGQWAVFSTKNTTDKLYAVTSDGQSTLLPGDFIGTKHTYEIIWTANAVYFYVDNSPTLFAAHTVTLTNLRPMLSDSSLDGQSVTVEWMHFTPYSSPCTFTSRVFDAGQIVDWLNLASWTWGSQSTACLVSLPPGPPLCTPNYGFTIETRTGNSATPNGTWSDWQTATFSIAGPNGRYMQYRASLSSDTPGATLQLYSVVATYLNLPPAIYRVAAGGVSDPSCGADWSNPCNLQYALATLSSAGDELWVKQGTYTPGNDRTSSFMLKNGVAIFGGFAGAEVSRDQRNFATHVTILSGEIGTAALADNSYHVVVGSGTDSTAVLDGFTIMSGNASENSSASPLSKGGGMYNDKGSPTAANLIFNGNYATFGGGMYNGGEFNFQDGSHPHLTNVTFSGNSASEGGGMRNENYSDPILTNVIFSQNTAIRSGGGMENFYHSSPTLVNVTFNGNTSDSGGGVMNWSSSSPILTNVTFHANTAIEQGGGMYNDNGSSPGLTNVTLSGNAALQGGGLYNAYGSNPVVANSVLHGDSGGEFFDVSGTRVVTYSIVQGGYPGTGNLDADPLLGPLQDNGGLTQTMALLPGSPAINAGDDANCPSSDQRGVERPQGNHCDIGAYEYQITSSTFADVHTDYWAWNFIERLYKAGITAGCGVNPPLYCPEGTVTRAQMSVFVERGIHGSSYNPPAVGGSTGFGDVRIDYWSAAWIKQLAAEGITGGCGSGNYCPESPVTRAQMAVFLLRSKHGASYSPPAVGGSTGFGDVPPDYWAGAWIKQLMAEGITAGCGSGNYCPESPVTRAQMAVFLVRTFGLP